MSSDDQAIESALEIFTGYSTFTHMHIFKFGWLEAFRHWWFVQLSPTLATYSFNWKALSIIIYYSLTGLVVSALMHLLLRLPNLTELVVINLCVERYEANRLLDYISVALSASMKHLTLVNLTESHCALTQIEMFSNLEVGPLCIFTGSQ